MKRGMGAVLGAAALVFGWGVAHAQEASPGGIPGQAEPVAPPTGQGDINLEVKPGLPEGTKLTQPMVPGTTTDTRVVPATGTTTTTTGDVKVEVEAPAGQPPPNVNVNVTPAPQSPKPPGAVAPTTGGTPAPVPTPGGEMLTPEAQTPALNNGVSEMSAPVAGQPIPYPAQRPYYARYNWTTGIGTGVLVGGGVEDFTNGSMQNLTGTAGSWNARFVAGTHKILAGEAAYAGSARSIDALGLSNTAVLMSNGVEGLVRLNIPIVRRATLLEPFGFAGVGWSHYSVTNTAVNTSSVAGGDDIMTVPFGGGFAVGYGAFMADARFTYRQTFYNDLMQANNGNGALNTWGVSGQFGVAF